MSPAAPTETVVLLHGLGRGRPSMAWPARRLRREGFRTLNVGYPSVRAPVEELARGVADRLWLRLRGAEGPVHFLTHSMGGIVLRSYLQAEPPFTLGRVVMLCPPNQGSRLAREMVRYRLVRRALGPALEQLTDGPEGLPAQLGPVPFELGVITGDRPRDPLAYWVPAPSDGRVAVEEARVEGMSELLVVPRGHSFVMNDPAVLRQVVRFFRTGRFGADSNQ